MNQEKHVFKKNQHMPKIIAAIPCLNEERYIGSVILQTRKFVSSVVVVDDGSVDATAEIAAEAGAAVYRHDVNRGYGAAIRSALREGRRLGADILVILDGDGQHNPNDIPELVKPLLEDKADVVVGSRFLGESMKPPLYRRLGQRLLTFTTNLGSGQTISDSQSGFRAYSSKALKELTISESGMAASSELQFAMSSCGLRVAEVPIFASYLDNAKRNPIGHGLNVLIRLLVLISLRKPFLLFGAPGLVLMACGLALGIRVLTIYSDTRELAIGNAMGMILLFLAGLLAVFSALMLQAMKELMRREVTQLTNEMKEHTAGEYNRNK